MGVKLEFIREFFDNTAIHGLGYSTKPRLSIFERICWFALDVIAFLGCVIISLQSVNRYNTKSSVITLEKDYYSWNISLPSLTICPMHRLNQAKFDNYCRSQNISGQIKDELFWFLESLANSSYFNFENINDTKNIEEMKIDPQEYMLLIYNLTYDLTLIEDENERVRTFNNMEFIHVQQVLTEYGICYMTNNYLTEDLSARLLITGIKPDPNPYEEESDIHIHHVRHGNLFDGDITYNFIGFQDEISVFIHSPYETMDISRKYSYAVEALEFDAYSTEIVASETFAWKTTVSQRNCRFKYESNLTHFHHVYTKKLCKQECRINYALEKCKCIPHFYPNIASQLPVCHYKTLKSCFPPLQDIFLTFRDSRARKEVINCNCLPNCQESKVIVDKEEIMLNSKELVGSIGGLVVVNKYPLSRFKRQMLFTFTDLLVSIGGTAGLFLGFSVLGAVDVVYFFSLHLLCKIIQIKQSKQIPKQNSSQHKQFVHFKNK